MLRVLIADDSPTARALLREILGSDPGIQVVGEACDGLEVVEQTCRLHPDVVTMDLRMPGRDGLEATKEIMIAVPTPIVIVTGSVAITEVDMGLHALKAGALAVLAKPPGPGTSGFAEARCELLATVKALAQVKVVRHWRQAKPATNRPAPLDRTATGRVVALAASTGGPAALYRLLGDLPGDFPAPILVVQHISTGFVAGLAEWLNKAGPLHVQVAHDREVLAPHTVYLAPDGKHLGLAEQATIALSDAPPIGGFRPSASFLFETAARVFGAATVAVILTGMGEDGVAGLRAVRQAGGRVLAQDEQSSVVFGMPAAAIAGGLADRVLSIEAIPSLLVELAQGPGPREWRRP